MFDEAYGKIQEMNFFQYGLIEVLLKRMGPLVLILTLLRQYYFRSPDSLQVLLVKLVLIGLLVLVITRMERWLLPNLYLHRLSKGKMMWGIIYHYGLLQWGVVMGIIYYIPSGRLWLDVGIGFFWLVAGLLLGIVQWKVSKKKLLGER